MFVYKNQLIINNVNICFLIWRVMAQKYSAGFCWLHVFFKIYFSFISLMSARLDCFLKCFTKALHQRLVLLFMCMQKAKYSKLLSLAMYYACTTFFNAVFRLFSTIWSFFSQTKSVIQFINKCTFFIPFFLLTIIISPSRYSLLRCRLKYPKFARFIYLCQGKLLQLAQQRCLRFRTIFFAFDCIHLGKQLTFQLISPFQPFFFMLLSIDCLLT